MSDFVDLRHYIAIVTKRWWLILLAVVVAAAIGYVVSQRQPRSYQAVATLIVGQSIQSTQLDSRDILTSQQLAQTYADLARRQPVLQGVIDTLGLSDSWRSLKGRVTIKLIDGTQLLEIRAEANSPGEAEQITDEIAQQLIRISPTAGLQNRTNDESQQFVQQQLKDLQAKIEAGQVRVAELEAMLADLSPAGQNAFRLTQSAEQVQSIQAEINSLERLNADWLANYLDLLARAEVKTSANFLTVIEPAQLDPSATRPNVVLNALLAGTVGFLLALGLIFVRERLDDTLKSADDLSQSLGMTFLGAVGRIDGKRYQDKLTASRAPLSRTADDYRYVRSNIQFMSVTRPIRSILVTSPSAGVGKTTTVANLGVVMAQAGLRTILVDADLRQPRLHQLFHVTDQEGLTDLLCSPTSRLNSHLRNTDVENLRVISSGTLPPNPSELLGSSRMKHLLASLGEIADIILIDSPPALALADTVVLSKLVDGVVLVFEAGRSRRDEARRTVLSLQQVGASLLGVVLNQVPNNTLGYTSHGYGGATLLNSQRSPFAIFRRIILRKDGI
ncbi:MAG TPA: polysaccharide biosynthesis tyrosine autokinase [Anaerolineae bacterium]